MKYLLPLYIVFLLASCKSAKTIVASVPAKDTVSIIKPTVDSAALDSARMVNEQRARIDKQKIEFITFSARVKMDYEGNDKKFNDLTAFIRIKKDSAIWVSLNAVLGIEAFRILIIPDSVKVLDKINKTIQYKDFKFLQEVTKLPIDFTTMQDLLVGNPVFMNTTVLETHINETLFQLVTGGELYKNISDFERKDLLIQRTRLQYVDTVNPRSANLEYGAYELQADRKFATRRKVNVQDAKAMNIDLDFKQVTFDSPVNFPFAIPSNYKLK